MYIRPDEVVKHTKTGNLYKVVKLGIYKRRFLFLSWWEECVVYTGVSQPSTRVYVRSVKDFEKNFKKL
jgi:hypothetical protein